MSSNNKTSMIAIAGPSCAGKTETAKAVAKLLDARIIAIDSYYLNLDDLTYEQRCNFNFDEPAALDHQLLVQQLRSLAVGNAIETPVYDFSRHTRAAATERIEPAPFLIIEGLFVLYWDDIRNLCDTTIYVDAPDDLCLERRQRRDICERGRTVESVLKQYNETVRPMAAKYVWPTKKNAGLVVSGTDTLDHCAAQVLQHIENRLKRPLTTQVASQIR
ncbi:MAG: uridine kinase [Terriglobales bacterium]